MSNETLPCHQQPGETSIASASRVSPPQGSILFQPGAGIAEAIKTAKAAVGGFALVLATSTCTLAADPWVNVQTDNSTHLSAPQEKRRKRSLREAHKHALQVLFQAEHERRELALKEGQATAIWEDTDS